MLEVAMSVCECAYEAISNDVVDLGFMLRSRRITVVVLILHRDAFEPLLERLYVRHV